ncbi:hypothetical protein Leryth_012440 [Lithospermum erythrorhizon]|nr:hypothetical protein Leryth_012440 [Lithospermum erythrorhizon]
MSLIAGSYEKFIWGYKIKILKNHPTLTLTPLFSYPSHLSPIKCAAVSASIAASGGADDTIKLYDLSTSSELGFLHHSSTITSLSFFTPPSLPYPRNLFAAGDDGSVALFDADPFVHLKTINVHKKSVNSMAVHLSGRVALSVGRDGCLAMVNLVRGRRSFYCRLGKEASVVRYSESGEMFFMVIDEKVSVHDSQDARIVMELENTKKVLCATPGGDGILFTGGEDKSITAWDVKSGQIAYSIEDAHPARVKGIVVLSKVDDASSEEDPYLVASASSDGVIRVWDVRMAKSEKPTPLAEANTKSRLTCLAGSSLKSLRLPRIGKSTPTEKQEMASEKRLLLVTKKIVVCN